MLNDCYGDACVCDPNSPVCQTISFKKDASTVSANVTNVSEENQNPESLRLALKDMMEPFLSNLSHGEH